MLLTDREQDRFGEFVKSIGLLLCLNFTLGLSKLIIGYYGQSSAMRSDGWNNSADFLYSILLAVGIWISTRPPDDSHPEGHERFESLMGIVIALIIMGTGSYVLWDSVHTFFHPRSIELGVIGAAVLAVSMVLKSAIAWFLMGEEKRLSSPSLGAIGRDQAGDVLADLSVVAAMVASYSNYLWIDPAVAGIIGLMILKLGWEPLVENVEYLTGRAPSDDVVESIKHCVDQIEVFRNPSRVVAHYVGPSLYVSLTVKAPDDLPLAEVHQFEEELRSLILDLDRVERVYIHVEPEGVHTPH